MTNWRNFTIQRIDDQLFITFPFIEFDDQGQRLVAMLRNNGWLQSANFWSRNYSEEWQGKCQQLIDKFAEFGARWHIEVPPDPELSDLQEQLALLQKEIEELKKQDAIANSELASLEQKLKKLK